MKITASNTLAISKFFTNPKFQVNLANFLAYTAEEMEEVISQFEEIDLDEFDDLDEEEKEEYIGGLWFAANITADEVRRLMEECKQVSEDYRNLSEALLQWNDGDPNPLTNIEISHSFRWVKGRNGRGVIYELKHSDINLSETYMMDIIPFFGQEYFTAEALDYMELA